MFHAIRSWRIVLVLFGLLALLVVVLVAIPWKLKQRWAEIEAHMAEAGITGTFLPLEAKPLSAEGNFFHHPDLIDLPLNATDPARQKQLDERRQKLKDLSSGLEKVTLGQGAVLGQPIDFRQTARHLLESNVLTSPPPEGLEAQAIRAALEARPALRLLQAQAEISQQAEFIPSLAQRSLPALLVTMPMPHLDTVNRVSKPLILHGMACAELGDFNASLIDLKALVFISQACHREGSFIPELVAVTIDAQTLQLAWSMLAKPTLPTKDLLSLREQLNRLHDPDSFHRAATSEFAIGLQTLEHFRKHPQAWLSELAGKATPASPTAARLQSNSWILDLNRCFYAEVYLDHFLLPLTRQGLAAAYREAPAMAAQLRISAPKWMHFHKIFATLMIPTTEVMLRLGLHAQTQFQQALTACELELFQRQHGRYPTQLSELPHPSPRDPGSQSPLAYRQTGDGRYQLWSTGLDGKDDQGAVPQPAKDSAPKVTQATYLGDWTWRYTLTP